jgi:hypothetical protein
MTDANPPPSAEGPEQRLSQLARRMDEFREQIRDECEHAVKGYLRAKNPQTGEEKRAAVGMVNTFIDHLGLTILYENKKCRLNVSMGKLDDKKGSYRLVQQGLPSGKYLRQSREIEDVLNFSLSVPIMTITNDILGWTGRTGDIGGLERNRS